MNLVYSLPSLCLSSGGPPLSTLGLARGMVSLGLRCGVLALDFPHESQEKKVDHDGLIVCLAPCSRIKLGGAPFSYSFERCLDSLVGSVEAQLIHDNSIWLPSNHSTVKFAEKRGIPLVISPRGSLSPWSCNHKRLKKMAAWCLYQRKDLERAALIHATSEQEACELQRVGVACPIAVVPNGVDVPIEYGRNRGKKPPFIALFLSRIHEKKGLLELVRAWGMVRPPGWKLVVAGEGDGYYLKRVLAEVRRLDLGRAIEFWGAQYGISKARLFDQSNLFILPTYSENFGIAIAEALSYGLPCITTKGAPWESLLVNDSGWWVDVGVISLAEAIGKATSLSEEARVLMGHRGRVLVQESYAWLSICRKMKDLYAWVLSGGILPKDIQIY